MNRLRLWIIAALAAALALSIIGVASAQPTPPPGFWGEVTSDGGTAVEAGLPVEAHVDGEDCTAGSPVTYTREGQIRYTVFLDYEEEGCIARGSEVRFRIGDRWASQTVRIGAGDPTVNLTLGSPTVTVNVSVWRLQANPTRLFVSTQAPGRAWVTHDELVMKEFIGRNAWDRSDPSPVEVTLADDSTITINVSVWRLQADPTRLFVSTQAPGRSWVTHDELEMKEFIGRNAWDRSDPSPVEVELR